MRYERTAYDTLHNPNVGNGRKIISNELSLWCVQLLHSRWTSTWMLLCVIIPLKPINDMTMMIEILSRIIWILWFRWVMREQRCQFRYTRIPKVNGEQCMEIGGGGPLSLMPLLNFSMKVYEATWTRQERHGFQLICFKISFPNLFVFCRSFALVNLCVMSIFGVWRELCHCSVPRLSNVIHKISQYRWICRAPKWCCQIITPNSCVAVCFRFLFDWLHFVITSTLFALVLSQ